MLSLQLQFQFLLFPKPGTAVVTHGGVPNPPPDLRPSVTLETIGPDAVSAVSDQAAVALRSSGCDWAAIAQWSPGLPPLSLSVQGSGMTSSRWGDSGPPPQHHGSPRLLGNQNALSHKRRAPVLPPPHPHLCLDNGSCGGLEQGSVALGVGRLMSKPLTRCQRFAPTGRSSPTAACSPLCGSVDRLVTVPGVTA